MAHKFSAKLLASLRELLSYDPGTGLFVWLKDRNSFAGKAKVGAIAGTPHDGYVQIGVLREHYRAHILAYWFMTGDPVPLGSEIDHRDRDRSNNRWNNLRVRQRSRNNHNANPSRANKSGVRGVSWVARTGKWHARISVDRVIYGLGNFADFNEAVAARRRAEIEMLGEYAMRPGDVPAQPVVSGVHLPVRKSAEEIEAWRIRKSTGVRCTNKTGCPGVGLHKKSGLWYARIGSQYRTISLGYFKTFEEAVAARRQGEAKHLHRKR